MKRNENKSGPTLSEILTLMGISLDVVITIFAIAINPHAFAPILLLGSIALIASIIFAVCAHAKAGLRH